MPLTPNQDGALTGNGVAYIFMSEVAQYYVSENSVRGGTLQWLYSQECTTSQLPRNLSHAGYL